MLSWYHVIKGQVEEEDIEQAGDKAIVIVQQEYKTEQVILPIGDIHYDYHCDLTWLEKDIEEIKQNGYLTFVIGDLFDIGFKSQILDLKRKQSLNDAKRELIGLLSPIRSQILGIVEGNHDRRIEREVPFNFVQDFCSELKIPYIPAIGIFNLKVGKNPHNANRGLRYTILVTHGWGGGRTTGGLANKLNYLSQGWEGIDMFVIGHLHRPMSIPQARFRFNYTNNTLTKQNVDAVVLSAYQEYTLYSARMGMRPGSRKRYIISLNDKHKKISIWEEWVE